MSMIFESGHAGAEPALQKLQGSRDTAAAIFLASLSDYQNVTISRAFTP
jgi:hypothetical protein